MGENIVKEKTNYVQVLKKMRCLQNEVNPFNFTCLTCRG